MKGKFLCTRLNCGVFVVGHLSGFNVASVCQHTTAVTAHTNFVSGLTLRYSETSLQRFHCITLQMLSLYAVSRTAWEDHKGVRKYYVQE